MVGTLTAIFVVLSLLAVAIIGVLVYLLVGRAEPSGECPNCGARGRMVIHDRAGLMSTRCRICNR